MEIDQLESFVAVVEHGTFTRAAQSLHLAQSTVSFQVRALETAVGARLLDRRRDRVHLTPHGRLIHGYATRVLALRQEALGRIGAEKRGEAGRLVVAASTIPAEYLLPRILAELRAELPGVDLVLEVSDSAQALRALLADECELALVGARAPDARVVYAAVADDEIVLVGPAQGPLSGLEVRSERDLAHVPLVLRREGSGTRASVARLLASIPRAQAPRTEVTSTESAKRCVLAGLGVTFLSRRAVAEEVKEGRLVVLKCSGTPVRRRFFLARRRGAALSTAASALVKRLLATRR